MDEKPSTRMVDSRIDAPLGVTKRPVIGNATDALVWRYCMSVIRGDLTPSQLETINRINVNDLEDYREYAESVVLATKYMIANSQQVDMALVAGVHEACSDWQRRDFTNR